MSSVCRVPFTVGRGLKYSLLALVLVLSFCGTSFAAVFKGADSKALDHDPHAIIVKFKPRVISLPNGGYNISTHEAMIRSAGIINLNVKYRVSTLKKIFRYAQEDVTRVWNKRRKLVNIEDLSGYYKIYFPDDVDVKTALEDYRADPNVLAAEPDYIAHIMGTIPSDADFSKQWGLYNTGQGGGTAGCDIKAPEAWDICKGTLEVIIAVVDSGVDTDHPDLASKLIIKSGCNFVEGGSDPNPRPRAGSSNDGCEHGTHVAGIAAAVTDNPTSYGSVAGVAWNCSIMPVKVLDKEGSGSYSAIAGGIEFAANNGADVINLSLGGDSYSSVLQSAINYAYALGCVIVAAAGNGEGYPPIGYDITLYPLYPVCNDGGDGVNRVVGVAATDNTDAKTVYSNFSSQYVDVSAPGGDFPLAACVYSTVYHNSTYGFDNWFDYMAGTSMATPFVSGLAALIISRYPGIDNTSVVDLLMNATDYIDGKNPGFEGKLGTGRINAFKAMTAVNGLIYALISYPRQSNTVYGFVNIKGSASWEGSGFYRISTAEGVLPSSAAFRSLYQFGTIIDNGLLATWDTTGLSGTYTIKLSIDDQPSYEVSRVVYVGNDPNRVRIMGRAIGGPNPFNPARDAKFVFYYVLSSNADTYIAIYNMSGAMMWKKKFFAGENGGRQGENTQEWDGHSIFGKDLSNGVYLYQIVSGDRLIGRDKIIIFR